MQGCSSDTVERLIKHHNADVFKETEVIIYYCLQIIKFYDYYFLIIIIQDGRSVLHFAVYNRSYPEVAELLVTKYSIDVNEQDEVQRD